MQVWDLLTTILTCIHNTPEAGCLNAFQNCDLSGGQQQVSQTLRVFRFCILETGQALTWHDEHVDWRLRLDVTEGDAVFILIEDVGGNVATQDFVENGILSHPCLPFHMSRRNRNRNK
jgi:hypothetical protein